MSRQRLINLCPDSHLRNQAYITLQSNHRLSLFIMPRSTDRACARDCGFLIRKCVVTIISSIIFALILVFLIIKPKVIKFHVTDATLADFNLNTTTNTLYYNLALNITISNPNKHISEDFKRIEARAYYEDKMFDAVTMTPFYLGHKKNYTLSPVFKGQNVVMLGNSELAQYNSDKSSGIYHIAVKLHLRITDKTYGIDPRKIKSVVKCDFKVPLLSNSTTSPTFQTTMAKCSHF
ncbi:NDR1/HIN1-like protein 10 [Cornus florida]|uniref:NDR1/HIN1-like protein 10 n=1 Tax=Cornus florida TaxID=4283 RepID=UPI002898ED0E|nr:NDR1/HIN1-like protein 10 [Cornus florida]